MTRYFKTKQVYNNRYVSLGISFCYLTGVSAKFYNFQEGEYFPSNKETSLTVENNKLIANEVDSISILKEYPTEYEYIEELNRYKVLRELIGG